MGKELKRWKRRKDAIKKINEIEERRDSALIVHYSCESFYDIDDGRTPRITSIAIRNFATGQTVSFSIHKCAEQRGIAHADIDGNYDELEKLMLDEYFDFLKSRHGYTFIHWNMRDINYGFQAIEHRYAVLGGEPFVVDDGRKVDLARVLVAIYGVNYVGHQPSGRLHNLVEHNKITAKDMLTGAEEAEAFEKKEFVQLHRSTLRKVDVMANILERVVDESLKTNASWWDMHGVHPAIGVEIVTRHWGWSLVVAIGVLLGVARSFGLI
jgi:hypothetical protein